METLSRVERDGRPFGWLIIFSIRKRKPILYVTICTYFPPENRRLLTQIKNLFYSTRISVRPYVSVSSGGSDSAWG